MTGSEYNQPKSSSSILRRVADVIFNIAASVVGGFIVHILVTVLTRLRINDPLVTITTALVIVIALLVLFAIITKRPHWFAGIASVALIITVVILWLTIVRVPNVIGMALTDAKAKVVDVGLNFEEIEMIKGGTEEVTIQHPALGSRLFKGAWVKLYYGKLPTVEIIDPKNGESVSHYRVKVAGSSKGVLGSSDFRIYVLVRSPDNHVWIQGPTQLGLNGDFSVLAQIGTLDLGRLEHFQIQAIVTTERLKLGDFGTEFPSFIACSSIIEVTRSQ